MFLKYVVKENDNYNTINEILKNEFNISSRLLAKLIKNKKIMLNDNLVDTRNKVKFNDVVTVLLDLEEDNSNILPMKMDLKIIYEDECFLVIDKPTDIAVHPSILHYENSLSNGIKYYFDLIGLKKKIRPVNRLDLNTSGLMVFAKNEYIQECLVTQMKNKIFKKEYIAICSGIFKNKTGLIDEPIARKENSIIERCIDKNIGQPSTTYYEVLKENLKDNYSIVKCILKTGRTHQIRVHMAYIGHPLLGDTLYGTKSDLINRQALHSYKITFIHPITKNKAEFISDFPDDFNNFKYYIDIKKC